MTDLGGRFQPFVAVTQSNAFAMPAKGNLRPETVIGRGLTECPLADQKDAMKPKDAAVRTTLLKPP
jgi:hypothetical protein